MNVGNHIGQYRILRKIGAGGMGTVYLGEHILLGRRAAIKMLLPALSMNPEIVERFFTEARATSAITDPGVVQIFDFGYHVDGTAYIVMELLEGESLQTRIERLGKIAPSDALRIARQVAGSLAAAHDHEIVHRDLKPENIYLIHDAEAQGGERTKLLDFGICKLGHEASDVSLTQSGTTMGTPVYMSPEQCRGAGLVDHRSDIYALGCVLFHMVAGRPPFECDGAGEFIVAHLQQDPPTPSTFIPELPDLIDGLILRCLEKSADDRFQSMTELQHALEYVVARISASSIVVPPVAPVMPIAAGYRSAYAVHVGTPAPRRNLAAPGERSVLVTASGSRKAATSRRRKSNSSKAISSKANGPALIVRARGSQVQPISTAAGTPSSLRDAEDPQVARPRPRHHAAIAIVLFGVVAALFATVVAMRSDEAVAGAVPEPVAATSEPAAATDTAIAPSEPAAAADTAIAPPATAISATSSTATPSTGTVAPTTPSLDAGPVRAATIAAATAVATRPTAKVTKAARPKAKPQRRPASRPSITSTSTRPPPTATAPTEDLYDTR